MSSNIRIGDEYEDKVIEMLHDSGHWVYHVPKKVSGQPVDIIAAKGSKLMLVDAKHVRYKDVSFKFDRIEPNQWSSMGYAREFAGIECLGFAIFFERTNEMYWLHYDVALDRYNKGEKSIHMSYLKPFKEML